MNSENKTEHFFTSDTHFFHTNILKYCSNRSFLTIEEMNEALFNNMIYTVPKDAVLWILGDIAFRGKQAVESVAKRLSEMPFKVKIITGNHDKKNHNIFKNYGLFEANGVIGRHIHEIDGLKVSMSHYPAIKFDGSDIYLNGHVHQVWKFLEFDGGFNINVGVDVWDMKPISFEVIKRIYKKGPPSYWTYLD